MLAAKTAHASPSRSTLHPPPLHPLPGMPHELRCTLLRRAAATHHARAPRPASHRCAGQAGRAATSQGRPPGRRRQGRGQWPPDGARHAVERGHHFFRQTGFSREKLLEGQRNLENRGNPATFAHQRSPLQCGPYTCAVSRRAQCVQRLSKRAMTSRANAILTRNTLQYGEPYTLLGCPQGNAVVMVDGSGCSRYRLPVPSYWAHQSRGKRSQAAQPPLSFRPNFTLLTDAGAHVEQGSSRPYSRPNTTPRPVTSSASHGAALDSRHFGFANVLFKSSSCQADAAVKGLDLSAS